MLTSFIRFRFSAPDQNRDSRRPLRHQDRGQRTRGSRASMHRPRRKTQGQHRLVQAKFGIFHR